MAQYIVDTTDQYTKLICNTSSTIIGEFPTIKMRIHYSFQIRLTEHGAWYHQGTVFTFHNKQHRVNLNVSFGSGGGTTGVLAQGYLDLGWGNGRKVTHTPGFSVNSLFSGGGTARETLTIPSGTLTANLVSYTHNSCIINAVIKSPYNYWYVRIYNITDKKWATSGGGSKQYTIGGLLPGKDYQFNVKLIGRDGGEIKSIPIRLKTTGFSYVEDEVQNILGDSILFTVEAYDDNFTNVLKILYDDKILYAIDEFTTYDLSYGVNFDLNEEQIEGIYESIPTAVCGEGKILIDTYEDGKLLGSSETKIQFMVNQEVCMPSLTSYSYEDMSKAIDLTGNAEYVVQDVSVLKVKNIIAQGQKGATILNYKVEIGENVYVTTHTEIETTAVVNSNTGLYVSVIDSRGLQTTISTQFMKYFEYQKPSIRNFEVYRVNDVEENTVIKCDGTFDCLRVDGVDTNTDIQMSFRYKESDSSVWSAYLRKELTITDSKFNYNNIVGQFDVGKAYDFEICIQDYFQSDNASSILVKSLYELFIGDGYTEINGKLILNNMEVIYPFPIPIVKDVFIQCEYGLGKYGYYLKWKQSKEYGGIFTIDLNGQVVVDETCSIKISIHLLWFSDEKQRGVYIDVNGDRVHSDAVGSPATNGYKSYDLSNYIIEVEAGDVIGIETTDIGIDQYHDEASYLMITKMI